MVCDLVRVYAWGGVFVGLGSMHGLWLASGLTSRAMESSRPREMRPLPHRAGHTFRDMGAARPREMRLLPPLGRAYV